jgi:polyisoprenoid-binding protein YceI
MKKSMYAMLIIFAVLVFTLNAHAMAPEWTIDKAHSGVYFGIQHIYSTVKGNFDEFDGKIRFDPSDLGRSRFDFTVAIKSVNTQNTKRDQHLLSDEFFDEKKYPKMTFKSSAVKHLKADRYTVTGTLTIKDVSQTVTVPFTYFGSKPNPFNPKQMVAGFEAGFAIDRIKYHVGNGKFLRMGVVGKDVTILITIEATRDK